MDFSRLLSFIILSCIVNIGALARTYNVDDYGATGDGKSDDTKAFNGAWNAACEDATKATVHVPIGKTFLVGQVKFTGPCKSPINFNVDGNIMRPNQIWGAAQEWIVFQNVNGLTIDGSGQFDGQGDVYWQCKKGRTCQFAPHTLMLHNIENLVLRGLKFKDSSQMHITVLHCSNVIITDLKIMAPGDSPNTDGIHIQVAQNVQIQNSIIGTGDDCISIGTDTTNVNINGITCGPGHGISIGSLGKGNTEAKVEKITVMNSKINGATNGVRIKSWQGGSGYAKGISFQNISLVAVDNPIIIDQFYCDHQICQIQSSAVKVSDVSYSGITGTSASNIAINFNCSQTVQCEGIVMENVNIQPAAVPVGETDALLDHKVGGNLISYCQNARGHKKGVIVPEVSCLSATNNLESNFLQ